MPKIKKSRSTIPQQRGNRAQYAMGFISSAIFAASSFYTADKLLFIWTSGSLFIIITHLAELLSRIAFIFEEIKHVKSRYGGRISTLLSDIFTFSTRSVCLTVFALFSLIYMSYEYGNPLTRFHNYGAIPNICAFIGTVLCSKLFQLDYGPLYESILITKLNGLDYGSAMAYSFFHGYLQIVLPNKGNEQKGIKELMQDFESSEGIRFQIHKLLVLIPLSLYSPNNLEDVSEIVEQSKSLANIQLTRAGVRDRIYKNTVYKIKGKYYVCAEYATPLQTLHEIVSHNNAHANYYKKHSKQLALQFYLTLQNILQENPDCEEFCELLFFDDIDEQNPRKRIDVGEVLLSHLRKLKAGEKKRNAEKND